MINRGAPCRMQVKLQWRTTATVATSAEWKLSVAVGDRQTDKQMNIA